MQPTDTQPLIALTRGGMTERLHRGAYVIVSTAGEILHAYGNPRLWTYLRSAAKPFQMLPLVQRGAHRHYGLTAEELAVIAGSHSGESIHIETVRSILQKAEIPESALQCGAHLPLETEAAYALIRRNVLPTPIHSNCSGKHAGMLLAARFKGEPLDSYLDFDHPLQQDIKRGISELSGVPLAEIPTSRDGCGAPIFALPLERIALLYARLAQPRDISEEKTAALQTVRDAMMYAPYLVAGKGRLCVRLMEAFPGRLVSKSGAEGVYGIGLPQWGIGIALKVEDGDGTTRSATAIRALQRVAANHLGAEVLNTLWEEFCPPLRNTHGEVVGEVRWVGD